MISILTTILLKFLDSFISTTKNILVYKNKIFIASMMVGLSQFLFLTIITNVVYAKNLIVNIIIGFVSFIGALIAFKISDIFPTEEKTYINLVTSDNREDVQKLCFFLRKHKIDNIVTDSYTLDWKKTLKIEIISRTKIESKLVDAFINKYNKKYFREIIK